MYAVGVEPWVVSARTPNVPRTIIGARYASPNSTTGRNVSVRVRCGSPLPVDSPVAIDTDLDMTPPRSTNRAVWTIHTRGPYIDRYESTTMRCTGRRLLYDIGETCPEHNIYAWNCHSHSVKLWACYVSC